MPGYLEDDCLHICLGSETRNDFLVMKKISRDILTACYASSKSVNFQPEELDVDECTTFITESKKVGQLGVIYLSDRTNLIRGERDYKEEFQAIITAEIQHALIWKKSSPHRAKIHLNVLNIHPLPM
jgi:hypothetical protein